MHLMHPSTASGRWRWLRRLVAVNRDNALALSSRSLVRLTGRRIARRVAGVYA